MSIARAELILVVCTANICRSPLIELILQRGLAEVSEIWTASAGTQARTGAQICHRVAQQYFDVKTHPGGVSAHRAEPLTAELLEEATVILAAAEDVRADVVRHTPQLEERVFTIQEAAAYGVDFAPRPRTHTSGVVSDYAQHLNGARTLRAAAPTRRFGLWPARVTVGRDIAEGHTSGSRAHRKTLREVAAISEVILEQLGRTSIS